MTVSTAMVRLTSQLLAGIWDTHIRPLVIGKEITQVEAINTGSVNASLYAYRPWCVEVAVWDARQIRQPPHL